MFYQDLVQTLQSHIVQRKTNNPVRLTTYVNGSATAVLQTHAGISVPVNVVSKVILVIGIVAVTLLIVSVLKTTTM